MQGTCAQQIQTNIICKTTEFQMVTHRTFTVPGRRAEVVNTDCCPAAGSRGRCCLMVWSGVCCFCCVGIPPADPPLPGFTQSRDRAVQEGGPSRQRSVPIRDSRCTTPGASQEVPRRRPGCHVAQSKQRAVLNRLSNVASASDAAPRRKSV